MNSSGTRIHGNDGILKNIVRETLNKIFEIPATKFVIVTGTPFATTDNKDSIVAIGLGADLLIGWLNKLIVRPEKYVSPNELMLKKLVWIYNWDIFTPGWADSMVYETKMIKQIRVQHLKYYEPENLVLDFQGELHFITKNNSLIYDMAISCGRKFASMSDNGDAQLINFKNSYFMVLDKKSSANSRDWETGM